MGSSAQLVPDESPPSVDDGNGEDESGADPSDATPGRARRRGPRRDGIALPVQWRRIVELAHQLEDGWQATGSIDFEVVTKLTTTVLLFHLQLLGTFTGLRRPPA